MTAETGVAIGGAITEQMHGLNLLSVYRDQFKRGWSYTSVYLLCDRTDEAGNQSFGFFERDYKPRKTPVYLHNLTTILADSGTPMAAGSLSYTVSDRPATVHDLPLRRSDGSFQLIIWDERRTGEDHVTIRFAATPSVMKIYDPTLGTEPVKTPTSVDSLELALSNHPLIITVPPK